MLFGLIVWGSYEPALHAWNSGEYEGEGALRIPVWPARFVVMLGSFLVAVTYVAQTVNAAIAIFGAPEPDEAPQPGSMGL
jgi:TRAP-type mannitol/chloroaromatic compound transport system permease small subunit